MKKNVWDKNLSEMEFNEIVDWMTGQIIFGIARGEKLHDIVYSIMIAFVQHWKRQ